MDETSCRVGKAFICLTALVQLPCPPYRQIIALCWDVIGRQLYPVILDLDRLDL
jgi:hypothetical protein